MLQTESLSRNASRTPQFIAVLFALVTLVPLAGPAAPAPVQAGTGVPGAGTLLLATAAGQRPATLLDTDVSMTVNGLVARVSVMQQFRNTGTGRVEGVYLFPLPGTAAVDRMRLLVGDRVVEGEIREKEAAKQAYEQARQQGRKASLVEQQRANLFTTSVANIAPGETVIVEIEYLEEVRFDSGRFHLRYPMTITPRYEPGAPGDGIGAMPLPAEPVNPPMALETDGHRVSLRVSLNAGLPLVHVASRYHPVHVSESSGRYSVTLAGGRAPMDRDFELTWQPVPAAVPRALAFGQVIDGEPYYLFMVVPPGTAATTTVPRDVIFIIDTSGSMHGASLEQAKAALVLALERLGPLDRFNVIAFSDDARAVFPGTVAANAVNVGVARTRVGNLVSSGGTEMYPALALALGMQAAPSGTTGALRQLVFITDGAVSNEEALFGLIRSRLGASRVFTVGIGSAPNSWFMRMAAETGRGSFTLIGSADEVGEKMTALFQKLESPQLTNIELHWPGGLDAESFPATVPDLYNGEPVAVRARLANRPRPGDRLRVTGDSPAGAWSRDLALDTQYEAGGVAALWARARIAALLDARNRGADAGMTRREVVSTALRHHLVSPYTSLVAVDRTPAAATGVPGRREQVASLLPHGQSAMAAIAFPGTATASPMLMRSGLLLLAAAGLLWAWRVALPGNRNDVPA